MVDMLLGLIQFSGVFHLAIGLLLIGAGAGLSLLVSRAFPGVAD